MEHVSMVRAKRATTNAAALVVALILLGTLGAVRATTKSHSITAAAAPPIAKSVGQVLPARNIRSWLRGWPMVGHDPQRTNRSPVVGPLHPHLLWTVKSKVPDAVIGSDGTVYAWGPRHLVALSASGHQQWLYPAWEGAGGPPAIAPNGEIGVLGSPVNVTDPQRSTLLVITSTGRIASKTDGLGFSKGAAPLMTKRGNLYVPFVGPDLVEHQYGALVVVTVRSGLHRFVLKGRSVDAVAQGSSGTLFALVEDDNGNASFLALSSSGSRLWEKHDSNSLLLVGSHGRAYTAGTNTMVAYGVGGKVLWRLNKSDGALAMALRADGSLLVAGEDWLEAVNSTGKRLWRLRLGKSSSSYPPSVVVDAAGTAYVASDDGELALVSRDGKVLDRLAIGSPRASSSRPTLALGPGKRLLVSATDGALREYGP